MLQKCDQLFFLYCSDSVQQANFSCVPLTNRLEIFTKQTSRQNFILLISANFFGVPFQLRATENQVIGGLHTREVG